MDIESYAKLATLLLTVTATGCALGSSRSSLEPAEECLIAPGVNQLPVVGMALLEPIRIGTAPVPVNDSERLVYRHLYETLVQIDCSGRLIPALATGWRITSGGRQIEFSIRDGAQFWNLTPVTADMVVRGWFQNPQTVRLMTALGIDAESVRAENGRVVSIALPTGVQARVEWFADPRFSLWTQELGSDWPLGSGPYRILRGDPTDVIAATPVVPSLASDVTFQPWLGPDARDALDGGTDVLITSDPTVIEYSESRSDFSTQPLPWSRTYVLLAPDLKADDPSSRHWDDFQASLARDAVRSEARPAREKKWWMSQETCTVEPSAFQTRWSTAPQSRIAYPRGDRAAAEITQRLVALAAQLRSGTIVNALPADLEPVLLATPLLRADGLEPAQFAAALRNADGRAFVVPLPSHVYIPCHETRELIRRAAWLIPSMLRDSTGPVDVEALHLGGRIAPLVEIRSRVITRAGVAGLAVDWAGTVHLLNP